MDTTLQDLLNLAEKGNIEQRCAALLVLGALKISNAATTKLVATMLDSANPVLKDYALRYFEEVQPKNNTAQLLKMLDDSDKDMQERAVRSLSGVGSTVVPLLLQQAKDATRTWQLNAARVLAAVRGKAALKGLLQMLSAGTDDTNKIICDLMTPVLREMESKELEAFYDEVEAFAAKLDVKQQRPAVRSTMQLWASSPGRKRGAGCSNISAPNSIPRSGLMHWSACCVVCASRSCAKTSTPNCCRSLKRPNTPKRRGWSSIFLTPMNCRKIRARYWPS